MVPLRATRPGRGDDCDALGPEVEESGFTAVQVFAVEGPFWSLQNFDEVWSNSELRTSMLFFLRRVEQQRSLLGASAHLLVIGRKPD